MSDDALLTDDSNVPKITGVVWVNGPVDDPPRRSWFQRLKRRLRRVIL